MGVKSILIDPHPTVVGMRKRQQMQLLSALLLIGIPLLVFMISISVLASELFLIYSGTIIFIFILYLLSRTRYYDISLGITIVGFTIIPLLIWFFIVPWTPSELPRLMIWIFIATMIGALLSRTYVVITQGVVIISLMLFTCIKICNVPFAEYDSHLGTAIVIIFFVK